MKRWKRKKNRDRKLETKLKRDVENLDPEAKEAVYYYAYLNLNE